MSEVKRLSAQQVKEKVDSGKASLVCAYGDEEKFQKVHLKGAISMADFKLKLPSRPKDHPIVFYCA